MTLPEIKIADLVDWDIIRYYTEEIESYIGKMLDYKLDYTGDVRYNLKRIEDIFEDAEVSARRKLEKEDEENVQ